MATPKPPASSPTAPTPAEAPPAGRRTTRGLDPEIQTMARVDRLLSDLDDRTRDRIIQWLVDRYAADDVEPARYVPTNGEGAP